MKCPSCEHWNEVGARFCEECGSELTAVNGPAQVSIAEVDAASQALPIASPAIPEPPPQLLVPADLPAPRTNADAHLILDATGSMFRLGEVTTVGREDPTLQIDFDGYVNGQFISHRHAQISKRDSGYYIEDLGSANATRVNDHKLAAGQSEPLHDGDKIRMGKIELTFRDVAL